MEIRSDIVYCTTKLTYTHKIVRKVFDAITLYLKCLQIHFFFKRTTI